MRMALGVAAFIFAIPAHAAPVATCLPNEGVLLTAREMALFGVKYDITDDPTAVAAFLAITGFPGDSALVKRLLWLFGRPDGSSIVALMGETSTCHRLGLPTASIRELHSQVVGVRA
jgi:hypothetical protein